MAYDVEVPDYFTSEHYTKAQEELFPFYSQILKGEPDPYFGAIGEYGGQAFEDILGLTQRDVTRGVTEDFARRNVRGARGSDVIARAMGDITKKMRWDDYSRSLKGRETLLGVGTKGMEGVRQSGLQYGSDVSGYGLQKAGLEFDMAKQEQADKAARDKMWSDIIGSVIGGGATLGAGYFLGAGKTAAKTLGGAGGGGFLGSGVSTTLDYEDLFK